MNANQYKRRLDTDDFWLLVRRFCMAPEGDRREISKANVFTHMEGALSPSRKSSVAIIAEERALFEAVGTKLHKWDGRDYERNYRGAYTWTTQRQAWEIWCAAREIIVDAP